MLKRNVLEPLRGRNVLVFPDNDAIGEWSDKLQTMQDIANFRVVQDDLGMREKGDVGDSILSSGKVAEHCILPAEESSIINHSRASPSITSNQ